MKNYSIKITFSIAILLLGTLISSAQTRVVKGRVFAFKESPLMNIKVEAKKSGATTKTDLRGEFEIEVKGNDKLVFEGSGFTKAVKKARAGEELDVKMLFTGGKDNEEIAVGQGHISRESLSYAVSNFLEYNNNNHTYQDIWMLIAGKFPGVKIKPDGEGGKKVVIREIKYLSGRSDEALYLVDGQIWQDISVLVPQEVKTINIMKDGSSLGFRAVNGAVVITTIDEIGKFESSAERTRKKSKGE